MEKKGQDRVKEICEFLKKETVEPARAEADKIIQDAKTRAEQIIQEAKFQAKKTLEEAKCAIEHERSVFHSSLMQASKQGFEALKHAIEHALFNESIDELIEQESSSPSFAAKLINAIVEAIEQEGVSKDFSLFVSKKISPEEVSRGLTSHVLTKLKDKPLAIGTFVGGVEVKLTDKKLALVITDKEISEFLKQYVRKDFRKYIFNGH